MTPQTHRPIPTNMPLPKPQIHGHRAARGLRPENTLAAVEYALRPPAVDGIEVDLAITADDIIVLHHDLCLNPAATRDATGQWLASPKPIRQLRHADLSQYDVGRLKPGADYTARFPQQRPTDGARIPTLDDCVNLLRGLGKTDITLNLEIKNAPRYPNLTPPPQHHVALLFAKLSQLKLPNPIFIQSFDWRLMRIANDIKKHPPLELKTGITTTMQPTDECRHYLPAAIAAQLTQSSAVPDAVLVAIAQAGANVWSSDHRDLTQSLIHQAHDLGLKVYAWTVNEPKDIEKLTTWGIDAITTDYPKRCHQIIHG